jgi:hypothetical protein
MPAQSRCLLRLLHITSTLRLSPFGCRLKKTKLARLGEFQRVTPVAHL